MKRRYLFVFTLFFAASAAFAVYTDCGQNDWYFLILIAIGAAIGVGMLTRRILVLFFSVIGLVSGFLFVQSYTDRMIEPLLCLTKEPCVISAEVCEYPSIYDEMQCVRVHVNCSTLEIDYPLKTFDTLLYLPRTARMLIPGDHIDVTAKFYVPEDSEGVNRIRILSAKGCFLRASSIKYAEMEDFQFRVIPCGKTPLRYYPSALAQNWKQTILQNFERREGGFLISLLLGDRDYLEKTDYQNLRKAGLSHISAVSGMHLMFLVAFLTQVFGKKIGTILSIPAVILFACMAGNTPSVMRASIMVIAAGISFLLMDEADSLTVLAFSLLVLLFHNPYSIASTSLQLSYLSTLGLILHAGRIQTFLNVPFRGLPTRIRKLLSALTAGLSCSCCALLFTTPVLLLTFGYVTILSPLSNLLTLSVVSLLFVIGFCFCICSMFTSLLNPILVPIAACLSRYILFISGKCAGLWWGILEFRSSYAVAAVVTVCLMAFVMICHKHSRPKFTLPVLCVILIAAVYQNAQIVQNTTAVTIHPVGNGQMISVAAGRDTVSLIDCGSGSNRDSVEILDDYMCWNSFDRIDQIILTAVDKAHARGLTELLHQYPIGEIVIPNGLQNNDYVKSVLDEIERSGIPCIRWEIDGEIPYDLDGISCSLIGGTDRKLGVRLRMDEGDLLILHSFTEKMLDELLSRMELKGDIMLWAPGNLEKPDLLKASLQKIEPKQLIFPSGADSAASKVFGVSTRNTYSEGEIIFRTTRIME